MRTEPGTPRQLWALQNLETGKYVDCLFEHRSDLQRWKWVDELEKARWFVIEALPAAFICGDGRFAHEIRVPVFDWSQWSAVCSLSDPPAEEPLPITTMILRRIPVHQGYEKE